MANCISFLTSLDTILSFTFNGNSHISKRLILFIIPGMITGRRLKVFLIAMRAISAVDNSPIFPFCPCDNILRVVLLLVMMGPGYNTLT